MQKTILLSIKPKIFKEIVAGKKVFEFRKRFPNIELGEFNRTVILYVSKPVMHIAGTFKIGRFLHSDFAKLMTDIDATEEYKVRISKYFNGNLESCFALEITDLKLFDSPITLQRLREILPKFVPGQSYRYTPREVLKELEFIESFD